MARRKERPQLGWELEQRFWQQGLSPVAGMDEAGRGALAGPVTVAAVVLPYGHNAVQDSKVLSAKKREALALEIQQCALGCGVAHASPTEIDDNNVLAATHIAARRALAQLDTELEAKGLTLAALISDHMHFKHPDDLPLWSQPRADAISPQVAAASILAKVSRDKRMVALAATHPEYGFAQHKGYGTRAHLHALRQHGACPQHRRSFRPVGEVL